MLSYDAPTASFRIDGQPVRLSEEEMQEMRNIKWWHSIGFSPELSTSGYVDSRHYTSGYLLDTVDFKNKTVLDIGCWDGFQLYYAEAHGATRVVGIDRVALRPNGTAAREFAKRKLGSRAEWQEINLYELRQHTLGTFDIVFCFGVIYHLLHPMLGLERACAVANETILLSTHFLPSSDSIPWCVLYPGNELADCPDNWSAPNLVWLRHALELQGFQIEKEHQYAEDRISIKARRVGERKYRPDFTVA